MSFVGLYLRPHAFPDGIIAIFKSMLDLKIISFSRRVIRQNISNIKLFYSEPFALIKPGTEEQTHIITYYFKMMAHPLRYIEIMKKKKN